MLSSALDLQGQDDRDVLTGTKSLPVEKVCLGQGGLVCLLCEYKDLVQIPNVFFVCLFVCLFKKKERKSRHGYICL